MEYHSPPINNIYDGDNEIKINNSNNIDITKKKNSDNKNEEINKNNKIDKNITKKYKKIKHIRAPTMVENNNKNKYFNDIILNQQIKNIDNSKFHKKNAFSPINNKFKINSLKRIKTINNTETSSSIINKFVNQINNFIKNNNLSNNTRTINSNNSKNKKYIINRTINLNKNNRNINHINEYIFSPTRKIIEQALKKNLNSTNTNRLIISNSTSLEKNKHIINNQNISKLSDRLLTYDFQDHHTLTRNRTFKNKKQLNNKTKYLNLLVNKKKINLTQAKELLISTKKSPKMKIKMNLDKNIIPNLQNLHNSKNKNNYYLLNNNTIINNSNLITSRKNHEQHKTTNPNINKIIPVNKSNKYIYLKQEKSSNNSNKLKIISPKSNNNIKINPFNYNYQNDNINKIINKKNKNKIK